MNVLKLTLTDFAALADTGVIRAAQRNIHQCKNGINKTLVRSPQGQPEHAFNDQNGGDGEIRIALRSSRDEGVVDSYRGLNSFIIQPESYGATVDEGFIVGGPSW